MKQKRLQVKTPKNKHRFRQITRILLKNKLHKKVTPERVKNALDELGPTFIKFGQILSTREDIIPQEYCDEFKKLKENVTPLPFNIIKQVIENELRQPATEVFDSICEEPIGSASIGQVHLATLKNKTKVVVKVMRPNIFEIVLEDFTILRKVVKYLNLFTDLANVVDLNVIFDETYEAMKLEMNFLNEQSNIQKFTEMFKDIKYVKVPKTFEEYTTEHLLVMEYIDGVKINEVDKLKEQGYDLKEICQKLTENFICQIIDKGIFHADPHSGNIMISGGKIVWIDLGMIGTISKRDQQLYKMAVIAIANNDVTGVKNFILTIGICKSPINHSKLYQDIETLLLKYTSLNVLDIDMGQFLQEVMQIARSHNISLPKGVTLLGRSMIIIQKVIGVLDPQTNLLELFNNHVKLNYKNELDMGNKAKEILKKIYKSGSKAIEIPSQLYDLLNLTIKGERQTNVEIINLNENVSRAKKMVNRLTLGLIVSSMIFALALIMASIIFKANKDWVYIVALILAGFGFIMVLFLVIIIIIMMVKDKK